MLSGSVEEECPNRNLAVGCFGLNFIYQLIRNDSMRQSPLWKPIMSQLLNKYTAFYGI
jgi:hypothetical protein